MFSLSLRANQFLLRHLAPKSSFVKSNGGGLHFLKQQRKYSFWLSILERMHCIMTRKAWQCECELTCLFASAMRKKMARRKWAETVKYLNSTTSHRIPPPGIHLLRFLNLYKQHLQVGTKCSKAWVYGRHFISNNNERLDQYRAFPVSHHKKCYTASSDKSGMKWRVVEMFNDNWKVWAEHKDLRKDLQSSEPLLQNNKYY